MAKRSKTELPKPAATNQAAIDGVIVHEAKKQDDLQKKADEKAKTAANATKEKKAKELEKKSKA